MRKVFVGAIVAAALITLAGRSSTQSTRAATTTRPPAPTTTTQVRPARTHGATRVRRRPVTHTPPTPSTAPNHGTTTSTTPARPVVTISVPPTTRPPHATTRTTSPPTPAQLAALHTKALEACLLLASANNSKVVAANAVWYKRQLHALGAHAKPSNARYIELVANEDETQLAMSAQYSIDVSNCYLAHA